MIRVRETWRDGVGGMGKGGRVKEGRRKMSSEKPDRTSVFSGPPKLQSQEETSTSQKLPFSYVWVIRTAGFEYCFSGLPSLLATFLLVVFSRVIMWINSEHYTS